MTKTGHSAKPDYFERLIDQALGVDGRIAPRLRSLFEPAPQPAIALDRQDDTPGPATTADGLQKDSPLSLRSNSAEPDREPAGPPAREAPPVAAAIARPLARTPVAEADEGATPAAALPLPARVEAAAGAADHAEHASATPAGPAPVPVSRTPARRRDRFAPAPTHLPARPVAAPDAASPRLVSDAGVAIERIFVTPPGAPRQRQPDNRRDHDLEGAAAPTVNITIGRVEVRAVTAPAPRPRASAGGPQPLGLDEYLKRRGEQ